MMSHFELTDETTELPGGIVLHRIRATVDLPQHGVVAGDLGGWIGHTGNLGDRAWVADEAKVYGSAVLSHQTCPPMQMTRDGIVVWP